MKRRILTTGALLSLAWTFGLTPVGASEPTTDDHTGGDWEPQSAFFQEPFVSVRPNSTIVVDFSDDPVEVARKLSAAQDSLDGRTVEVVGIETPSPSERQLELSLAVKDRDTDLDRCPMILPHPRTAAFKPYVGCDAGQGEAQLLPALPAVEGAPTAGLAEATRLVLATRYPEARVSAPAVDIVHGQAFVDFDADIKQLLSPSHPADGAWLTEALILTALSHEAVESVTFMIDGDCEAFAVASGGDSCGTASVRELRELVS